MKRSSAIAFRVLTVCLTVIVAIGVSSLAGSRVWTDSVNQLTVHVQGKMKKPPSLANHLKRMRAIPGNGGMSTEGPGSAEAEKFLALAFPDDDVPLARLQGARAAAARLRGRFPRGNGRDGTWVTVGPSDALYPATDFRSSFGYVPNAYVAGGRGTAIAIDPNCSLGHCRLWVFAAGGGVWRTKNALSGQPNLEFLSDEFGIQSGSSITLDPNDPTGDTLYVGTVRRTPPAIPPPA